MGSSCVLNAPNSYKDTDGVFGSTPHHSRSFQVCTHIDCEDKIRSGEWRMDEKRQEMLNILRDILEDIQFILDISQVIEHNKIDLIAHNLEICRDKLYTSGKYDIDLIVTSEHDPSKLSMNTQLF